MREASFETASAAIWRRFRANRGAVGGLVLFIALLAFCLLGPLLWQLDPAYANIRARNQGFSWAHPFGTDQIGRDLLARVMAGGRVSLGVGLVAMVLSILLGLLVGLAAGTIRWLDGALMRLTDLFLAMPVLPLILVMALLLREPLALSLGPRTGMFLLVVSAIALTSWMQTARILRAEVLAVTERDYIRAARAIGTPPRRIITRHILPNVLSPVLVSATLMFASAIITESALSFLGMGFSPELPTWGRLVADGIDYLQAAPQRALLPGAMISLTVLSVNYIGDGLRDALDPRLDAA